MRGMASNATFCLCRSVLERERACLVRMARETHLVLSCSRSELPRQETSVLIVAVAAHQQTLIHAMMHRAGEIRLHFQMAAVTKLRLRRFEEPPFNLGCMDRMAIDAADIVLQMFGSQKITVLFAEFMTIEAAAAGVGRGKLGKADDLRKVTTAF